LSGGFSVPGAETDTDAFDGGLNGLTPWGMTYDLHGSANKQSGTSFGFDTNTLSSFGIPFDNSQSSVQLDVTQPLLKNFWYDGTRLNIAVAKNRIKWTDQNLRAAIISTVTRVETAYYNLKFAYENVTVQQKGLELAQRLLAENKKRVEVGALAPLDEKQSEAEVSARQADLIKAQIDLDVQLNNLKSLLSDNFASWSSERIEPSDTLSTDRQLFNLQDSWSKGLTLRPEYLQATLDLEAQGFQLKYDKNQIYPQLDIFGTYGYNGSGSEFSDSLDQVQKRDLPFYMYGGRLVIPLGNGATRNRYKSSKAHNEQLLLTLKASEQSIMVDIDNAIKVASSNFERIEATRKAREYAEAALSAEEKKLENGKSTSFEVLRLQRDLTTARSEEIAAVVAYNISLAGVASAEGTTLERRKIDVTVK
jgi:outer membrane protein TolC